MIIEEKLEELQSISTTDDNHNWWFRRKTVIIASDNVTQWLMENLDPLSIGMSILVSFWLFASLWPSMVLFLVAFSLCRLCRWLNGQILSKLWTYNSSLFYGRQKKATSPWIWRDRTCVDIYTYCLLNRATAVPSDLPSVLKDQTTETSIGIILDRPRHVIEQHLKRRINSSPSRSLAIVTWLILHLRIPLSSSMDALKLVERFYSHLGIPVIKLSEFESQLDHDESDGDIQWSERSIKILLTIIEEAIKARPSSSMTLDEFWLPWQCRRQSHLYL